MNAVHRTDDLSVKPLGDELLIYDLKTDKAHSLNSAAALVYRLADGTLDVAGLASHVAIQLEVSPAEGRALTELALEQLSHRGLLVERVERRTGEARMSRRKVLQSLAVAAVAVPVIVSLSAPWPVVHASCIKAGGSCKKNACCQGLTCVGGYSGSGNNKIPIFVCQ
jgi:hypothetical protein